MKNNKKGHSFSDQSIISIPLRNLIAIVIAVGVVVTGYFNVTGRITFLEHNMELQRVYVDENSNFRIKWPLGELGALPDDAEQNMRLTQLEKQIEEIFLEMKEIERNKKAPL